MKLRVGVIGLGDSWESRYRSALVALNDRFQVRAIHSPVLLLAERAGREFGIRPTCGFREVVTRPDVDAVLVLASHWYGSLPILAACQAGKSIYCCGGLDLSLEEAMLVREHVDHSGVSFMAEFPRRLAPATVRLKELIATSLGPPKLVLCNEGLPKSQGKSGPAYRDQTGRQTRHLMETVDWCRYIVDGDPDSVSAVAAMTGDRAVYQTIHLGFPKCDEETSSRLIEIRYGSPICEDWPEARSFRPPSQLEVVCERGVAFVDLPSTLIWFDEAGRHMESLHHERPMGEELLMQFHRTVTSLIRRTSGLDDAYRALRIVLRAGQSIKDGRRKKLNWHR